MRIACYHNLGPGGARRVVDDTIKRLGSHSIDVFCPDPESIPWRPGAKGKLGSPENARSIPVPPSRIVSRLVNGLERLWPRLAQFIAVANVERTVARLINEGSYDVALVHPCSVTQSPGLLRRLRIPNLYYMHELRRRTFEAGYQQNSYDRKGRLRRLAPMILDRAIAARDKAAVGAASVLACNSYYTRESVLRAYGRDARVSYPGVDSSNFRWLGVPRNSKRRLVLSVGGFESEKGHDFVIRTLGQISPLARPQLVIAGNRGEARYREMLADLAVRNGVHVEIRPNLGEQELVGLYNEALLTVVGARLEPLGLVALESMSCGTPVVAVKEAGLRETVIHGVNGYLVDREVQLAAAMIVRALDSDAFDPERVRASVAESWDVGRAAQRIEELLVAAADLARDNQPKSRGTNPTFRPTGPEGTIEEKETA